MQADHFLSRFLQRALSLPPASSSGSILAQAAVWMGLAGLAWSFLTWEIDGSRMSPSLPFFILSRANLVFHEAGHVLFRPLGAFMTILGGSLLQVLVPLLCTAAFLTRHLDPFAASVTLWWTGQSLIDLGPYIDDARAQQLVLLGGGTGRDRPGYHDWNNLLSQLGLLQWDHTLARTVHLAGGAMILLAMAWSFYLIYGQWCRLMTKRS